MSNLNTVPMIPSAKILIFLQFIKPGKSLIPKILYRATASIAGKKKLIIQIVKIQLIKNKAVTFKMNSGPIGKHIPEFTDQKL